MSKKIAFKDILPLIEATVSSDGRFPLVVSGTSMKPFLREHTDTVMISKVILPIKKGDLLFVIAENGLPILHRVTKITDKGYVLTGDNQIRPSGPYSGDDIIGAVYSRIRNGKEKKTNTARIRLLVRLNRLKLRLGRAVLQP